MTRLDIAVALVWHQGELLVARRPEGAHQGGKWEFPGGKIEAGEDALGAAAREVLEETALEVTVRGLRCRIQHDFSDRAVELWVVDCDVSSRDAQPIASTEVRWVRPEELPQLEFPAANQSLLLELARAAARPR